MICFVNVLGYGGFFEMQQVFCGYLLECLDSYCECIVQMWCKQVKGSGVFVGVLYELVGEFVVEFGYFEEKIQQVDLRVVVKFMFVVL